MMKIGNYDFLYIFIRFEKLRYQKYFEEKGKGAGQSHLCLQFA